MKRKEAGAELFACQGMIALFAQLAAEVKGLGGKSFLTELGHEVKLREHLLSALQKLPPLVALVPAGGSMR